MTEERYEGRRRWGYVNTKVVRARAIDGGGKKKRNL